MSLVQQNALTVTLLHPPQGLKVRSDQSVSCCGLKWNASKQKASKLFHFFLICSTGFGRQLEEAPADETKCSFCCVSGRIQYGMGGLMSHKPWEVKCLSQADVHHQLGSRFQRPASTYLTYYLLIHHIQMYSTAFLLRTKTLLLQPSLTLIRSRIQTQSHQTNRDGLHICSNTLAVLFSGPLPESQG